MAAATVTPLDSLRIVWFAFLGAVCIHVAVPWFAIAEHLDDAAAATAPLVSGLRFGAIGAAVASFLVRRQFMNGLQGALQPGGPAADLWRQLQTGCIVTWAISEIVVLIGLAIALVARNPYEVIPYGGAALFLLYMHRLDMWPVTQIEQAMDGPR